MITSEIRKLFKPLRQGNVYLDSAATSLKPDSVINKIAEYYNEYPGSVHRGNYSWSDKATNEYEDVREKIISWCNASNYKVIYTSGATMSANIIAYNIKNLNVNKIHIALNDHHANIVPHRLLQNDSIEKDFDNEGVITIEKLLEGVNANDLVQVSSVFNATGQIIDIIDLVKQAKEKQALVALDMSQWMAHKNLDANLTDADFYYWSAHKHYGPTGIGVLLVKENLFELLEPIFGGGSQVSRVTPSTTDFNDNETKLEPGTPNISGVIGMGASIDFLTKYKTKEEHIYNLLNTLEQGLKERKIPIIAPNLEKRGGLISFYIPGMHSYDVAVEMGLYGIFVRSGRLCAHPVVDALTPNGFIRASLGIYNNEVDIARFFDVIDSIISNG